MVFGKKGSVDWNIRFLNKSLKKYTHYNVDIRNFSSIEDNYTLHPCNDKGAYNEICNEMYKANDVVIGPKQKSCMPGFGCRRVGFYCSLID